MKKLLFLGVMGIVCARQTQAQNEVDVLRYSQTTIGGTARSMSMGGAFGAVGADFSTLSTNPAGIGLYKHSEMTFSPTLFSQNSNSTFAGASSTNGKYNFSFNNAGFVYSYDTENETGWNNFNFGFGYNRLQDFNYRANYTGFSNGSMVDFYTDVLNNSGTGGTAFDTELATKTKLVYTNYSNHYIGDIDSARIKRGVNNVGVIQNNTIARSGGMGEINIAFGGNYSNKLYLGASLNFPTLNYSEAITHTETNYNKSIDIFQSSSYNQNLSTSASGFNFKAGGIYRITDWVRIGAYIQTPTVLNFSDDYNSSLSVNYSKPIDSTKALSYSANSPAGSFSYQITTPARQGGNVAFIIQKKAIISVDVEHINYAGARITSDSDPFTDANTAIQNKYANVYNFRFGGEYRLDNVFSLRAGYCFYQSPFKSNQIPSNINANTICYTGGFGIRGEGYFLDFAYVYSQQGQYIQPYSLSTYSTAPAVTGASIKNITQNFVMTIGFRF